MSKQVPPPAPQDVELALTAMSDDTNVFGQWARLPYYDEAIAKGAGLKWVVTIDPNGMVERALGGGTTLAEAAAVAWINTELDAWWLRGPLLVEVATQVSRWVPASWRFEVFEAPGKNGTEDTLKAVLLKLWKLEQAGPKWEALARAELGELYDKWT